MQEIVEEAQWGTTLILNKTRCKRLKRPGKEVEISNPTESRKLLKRHKGKIDDWKNLSMETTWMQEIGKHKGEGQEFRSRC